MKENMTNLHEFQEAYLVSDTEERLLESKEELEKYLSFRTKNDILIECPINALSAAGIENIPLFVQDYLDAMQASVNGYKEPCETLDYQEIEVRECIEQTGLFLIVPYNNFEKRICKNMAFPTSEYAVSTILNRCDDFCGTMARFEPKTHKKVLPVSEKAMRITRDFELYSDDCLVLVRDRKVRAVHSRLYDWLNAEELVSKLEEMLNAEHPTFSFKYATVTHEYLSVNYMLNDTMMEESLKMNLNDHGSGIKELKAGVQFITSDIGISSVKCNIILIIDDEEIVLGGVDMPHKNGATIETFAESLKDFGNILKEQEEKIEALGNIEITDVAMVVKDITDHYNSIFPSQIAEAVIDGLKIEFPVTVGGSAIDVYLALFEIINRHKANSKVSLSRYIFLTDQVSSMINLPFKRIEEGNYFKK